MFFSLRNDRLIIAFIILSTLVLLVGFFSWHDKELSINMTACYQTAKAHERQHDEADGDKIACLNETHIHPAMFFARRYLILFWTNYFASPLLPHHVFMDYNDVVVVSNGSECRFSSDRSLLKDAAAVVYHSIPLLPADVTTVLQQTRMGQMTTFAGGPPLNILWNREPNYQVAQQSLGRMDLAETACMDMFDIEVSYRLNAEVFDTLYFPRGSANRDSLMLPLTNVNGNTSIRLPPISPLLNKRNDSTILWVVSNCGSGAHHRMRYAQLLSQYISIDFYGNCFGRPTPEDFLPFVSNYKFYLAFENSICLDYVTEKVWRTLQLGLVPVVFGAPNIVEDYAPNDHSIINVFDYASPMQLARHLHSLNSNDDAYLHYLRHRWDIDAVSERYRKRWWSPTASVPQRLCDYMTDYDKTASRNVEPSCIAHASDSTVMVNPNVSGSSLNVDGSTARKKSGRVSHYGSCWRVDIVVDGMRFVSNDGSVYFIETQDILEKVKLLYY